MNPIRSLLATTPEPPYFAVIFTSLRTDGDEGYRRMSERMAELAAQQPGFLGTDSAREADGLGITVSYWTDEAAIQAWKNHLEHAVAQRLGKEKWYAAYSLRVAKVERASIHLGPNESQG
ncbi:MAG: antibiotic biosynthesis monooxygenase [Acidobacteriota bacterium]|nr:antibiotic biosynthesis monooxygenase [Acidobacteriota bacterium]